MELVRWWKSYTIRFYKIILYVAYLLHGLVAKHSLTAMGHLYKRRQQKITERSTTIVSSSNLAIEPSKFKEVINQLFVEEKTHIRLFDHTVPPIAKPNKKTDTKLKIFITLQLNNTDHRHNMNIVTTVRLTQKKREKASRVKNSSSCNLIKFSFRISPYIHTYIHTIFLIRYIYLQKYSFSS